MIVIRCQNCRTRVQVPSPGTYRCHNCHEIIEVKEELVSQDKIDLAEEETVRVLEKPRRTQPKRDSIIDADSPSAYCRRHPGRKAEKTCRLCGDLICEDCSIRLDNSFYCPDCIRKIQENAALASAGVDKYPSPGESSIPFENGEKDGYFPAFFKTINKIFLNYAKFFDNTGKNTQIGIAAIYGIIIFVINELARFLAFNYFGLSIEKPSGDMNPFLKEIYESFAAPTVSSLFLSPLSAIFGLIILAAVYHLGVLLMKGGGKYVTTFKLTCYATSSQIVSVILIPVPLIGTLIAYFFGILFITQGCLKLHNMSEGKSIFVALFPTIVVILVMLFILMPMK